MSNQIVQRVAIVTLLIGVIGVGLLSQGPTSETRSEKSGALPFKAPACSSTESRFADWKAKREYFILTVAKTEAYRSGVEKASRTFATTEPSYDWLADYEVHDSACDRVEVHIAVRPNSGFPERTRRIYMTVNSNGQILAARAE